MFDRVVAICNESIQIGVVAKAILLNFPSRSFSERLEMRGAGGMGNV